MTRKRSALHTYEKNHQNDSISCSTLGLILVLPKFPMIIAANAVARIKLSVKSIFIFFVLMSKSKEIELK